MRYKAILAPGAEEDLKCISDKLMPCVTRHLAALLDNPATLSRPSYVPFPPGYQLHSFDCESDGDLHLFHVLFQYGSDEVTLHIHGIGHVHYGRPSKP